MSFGRDGDWCDMTVAAYSAMIRERVNFAQAAYRDGEWYCITGYPGGNTNGEPYHPTLRAQLIQTLLNPTGQWCAYWWDIQKKGRIARSRAEKWLAEFKPPVSWIPDRPIFRAMEQGRARPFFEALAYRDVVLVGPNHLEPLDAFPIREFVTVPDGSAWEEVDRICGEVDGNLRNDTVVLFASGMAANVMIHRLWGEHRSRATFYDIGSALDPFVGLLSRGEYKTPGWYENVFRQNVP